MSDEFDIEAVRKEIEAEVRRKRQSGGLSPELERALDSEFTRLGVTSSLTEANVDPLRVLKRAIRKVLRWIPR